MDQEGTNLSSQHIDDKSEVDKSKLQLDDNDSVKDKKYTKKRKKGIEPALMVCTRSIKAALLLLSLPPLVGPQ